jgi:hypothetical protein
MTPLIFVALSVDFIEIKPRIILDSNYLHQLCHRIQRKSRVFVASLLGLGNIRGFIYGFCGDKATDLVFASPIEDFIPIINIADRSYYRIVR